MTKEQIEQIMNSDDHAKFENFNDLAQTALNALQRMEWLEQKLKAVLQYGNDVCLGCKREIDTTTCWCGDSIDHGFDSHSAVPMGCDCGRIESTSSKTP